MAQTLELLLMGITATRGSAICFRTVRMIVVMLMLMFLAGVLSLKAMRSRGTRASRVGVRVFFPAVLMAVMRGRLLVIATVLVDLTAAGGGTIVGRSPMG